VLLVFPPLIGGFLCLYVQSKITKTGMAREFLSSMLPRRGPKAYSRFIQALMSTEAQEFIAEELDKELPSDYTDSTGSVPRSVKSDEDIIKEVKGCTSLLCLVLLTHRLSPYLWTSHSCVISQ